MCIFEIFGRDVTPGSVIVGMGVHPFGDPSISDDFERVALNLDASEFHDYAADWTPERIRFFVDDELVREVAQSPAYPMQLMLSLYEFADGPALGVSGRQLSEGVRGGLGPRLAA